MTDLGSYQAGRRILELAQNDPSRTALIIDGETWSYGELVAAASALAANFPPPDDGNPQPITAIMAQRHVSSYSGILAARLAGHAYVPLNVNHPCQRNATILKNSGAQRVICGENAAASLREIVAAAGMTDDALPVINCAESKAGFDTSSAARAAVRQQSIEDLAYILFTSGSTGNPKGVPIQNAQLEAYLKAAGAMVDVQPQDRFSQTFELTFDLSVHDLVPVLGKRRDAGSGVGERAANAVRLHSGTRHHVLVRGAVARLPGWRLQEDLVPGAFPSLRVSLFCGEALPTVVATEWLQAAPNSMVENWYGPTEATIACSRYILSDEVIEDDTVPIGRAFDDMKLLRARRRPDAVTSRRSG